MAGDTGTDASRPSGEVSFSALGGWPGVLGRLFSGEVLSRPEAFTVLCEILEGRAEASQIGAMLAALRTRGETVEEITGFVEAMRSRAEVVKGCEEAIDTCGTGGDRAGTVNVSTGAALIAAGAGARVLKHGNRAASSKAGSADVLEALGVVIDLDPAGVARCVEEAGIGFCFAPRFHPAMRHAGPVRRDLGVATVFNFLGPLANPGRVRRQVVGVGDWRLAEKLLGVLAATGAAHAMVFYGSDGLDELTTTGPSTVLETRRLPDGARTQRTFTVDPAALGLSPASREDLLGGDPADNAEALRAILSGEPGAKRDIVALNASAALVVAGLAEDLRGGLELAFAALDSGSALAALERLVAVSSRLAAERPPAA